MAAGFQALDDGVGHLVRPHREALALPRRELRDQDRGWFDCELVWRWIAHVGREPAGGSMAKQTSARGHVACR